MFTSLFDYYLPPEKIAQHPQEPRDSSKLLVATNAQSETNSEKGYIFKEMTFRDITQLFRPGDVLVINDTKVMPSRIHGYTILKNGEKKDIECLFLRNTHPDTWEIMCFPGERLKTGRQIILENGMTLDIIKETYVGRLVRVPMMHHEWLEVLQKYGEIPLPPYITKHLVHSELYQTVYAEHLGSTASPTAGRHFTPELLKRLQDMGVTIAHVTLHIGPGTFKPIYEENITDYQIHSEWVSIPAKTIDILEHARKRMGRIIAVGTTSMRSLESYAAGKLRPMNNDEGVIKNVEYLGDTDLYITPGYEFQIVDVLITNFHAPRTSLLVLVAAFMGYEPMVQAYQYALKHAFRFLSFGDATWIENDNKK